MKLTLTDDCLMFEMIVSIQMTKLMLTADFLMETIVATQMMSRQQYLWSLEHSNSFA